VNVVRRITHPQALRGAIMADTSSPQCRGVNDTLLPIHLIRTIFDKMGMGKFFFR
jgi:hypothetical protein